MSPTAAMRTFCDSSMLYGFDGVGLVMPLLDVDGVLGVIHNRTAAYLLDGGREVVLLVRPLHQLVKQPARNDVVKVRRIDELEHDEVRQQQVPVIVQSLQQSLPVQVPSVPQDDVIDIRTVIPLAVLNIRLAPDEILGGKKLHGNPREVARTRMLKPRVVHHADVVDRIEYHVDEIFALEYLRQPSHIRQLRLISLLRKMLEYARIV